MKRQTILLIAIFIVAIGLRAYALVALPFEQDELYTIHESTELFNSHLNPGIHARPLFFLMMHPVVTALPHSAMVLRALPFLFGIAGVFATWVLARRHLGATAAIVAALFVSVSAWHIAESSFARYYSLLYLAATLVYIYLPAAYDNDRPRDYIIAMLALVVGSLTHPSFVFPVAAASLVVMAVRADGSFSWRWPTRNGWIFLWIPFLAICGATFAAIRLLIGPSAVGNGSWRGVLGTLRLIPAIVDLIGPALVFASVAGMIAMIASRSTPSGEQRESRGMRRFGLMTVAGLALTGAALVLLSFSTAIYSDYAIAALPLALVSGAALVHWLQSEVGPGHRAAVAVAVTGIVLAGVLPSTVSFLSDGSRFDYRAAYARIVREEPDVFVLTWPIALQQSYAPQLRSYEIPTSKLRLDGFLEREGNIWAVVSVKRYGIVSDDRGEIATWLSANCRLVEQYQRPRIDYRMYRVDLWRCKK